MSRIIVIGNETGEMWYNTHIPGVFIGSREGLICVSSIFGNFVKIYKDTEQFDYLIKYVKDDKDPESLNKIMKYINPIVAMKLTADEIVESIERIKKEEFDKGYNEHRHQLRLIFGLDKE